MAVSTQGTAPGNGAEVIESRNPSTGESLGTVRICDEEDVNAAVARARAAADEWGALGFGARRRHLTALRRELASRAEELADLIRLETGKPPVDAIQEVLLAVSHVQYASSRAGSVLRPHRVSPGLMANFRAQVSYHPLGVIGVIGPWNYPLFTPMGSIAYALAAGNAVVFKPSELTPLVGQLVADIASSAIPIPDLVQTVTGDGRTGAALARSGVDKLSFTGSAATGRKVMAEAAERLTPVLMELGGKDPMVVTADADVDAAADAAVFGAITNAGQACISIERCYVVEPVYDRFIDRVVEEVQRVKIGSDEDANIGSITRPQQVAIIRDHIRDAVDKGASVLYGGADAGDGNFVAPTVLAGVTPEMRIAQEETFGPVLPITKVANAEEAIDLANATRFGLGSAVFGRSNVRQLAERVRAGVTSVNSVMAYAAIPALPFGGIGESGFGRIHGDEGLKEFSRVKGTAEARFSLPFELLTFNLPKNTYRRIRDVLRQVYGGGAVDRIGSAALRVGSIVRRRQ